MGWRSFNMFVGHRPQEQSADLVSWVSDLLCFFYLFSWFYMFCCDLTFYVKHHQILILKSALQIIHFDFFHPSCQHVQRHRRKHLDNLARLFTPKLTKKRSPACCERSTGHGWHWADFIFCCVTRASKHPGRHTGHHMSKLLPSSCRSIHVSTISFFPKGLRKFFSFWRDWCAAII